MFPKLLDEWINNKNHRVCIGTKAKQHGFMSTVCFRKLSYKYGRTDYSDTDDVVEVVKQKGEKKKKSILKRD